MESKELASRLRCIIDDTERTHALSMVRLSNGRCISAYDERGDYPSTADYKRLQELYPELEEMDYLTLWKSVIDTPDAEGSATLSYAVEFWNENHGEGDTDRSSLEADLNEYYESISQQYSEYERKLRNLNWIEENPTVDVNYTSKIRSSTIKLLPLWPDGRGFIASDLPILFDAAVTSTELPILMLRAEGNDFYKVWTSRLEDEKSIDKVNQVYEEFQRQEHIQFMLLVLRGGRGTIVTWYDGGFTLRSLNAKSTSRNVDEDVWMDVRRTFLEAFSELRLDWDNLERTVIYADVSVRDHTLDLWTLYWLAWMSDALPLVPHEQSNNFAERASVFYHYLVPTIDATREADVRFQVLNIEGGGTVFSNMRAPNIHALNETLAIIGSIVNAVKSAETGVQRLFDDYGLDLAARESTSTTTISKITALKARAGEFFSRPGYTRKCSKARQPVIVDSPEVKGYEVGKFPLTRGGEPDDPRSFYYICPDSKTPYPGVVNMNEGTSDPNQRYLPCCFRTPQIGSPRSKYEVYRAMIEGREVTGSRSKGSKVLLVKVPGPGNMGEVPQDLERLVRFLLGDETLIVRRYGVEAGNNAFLRSVLFALGAPSPEYKMVRNLRDPELYRLRGEIADTIRDDNRTYWAQEWGLEKEALLTEIRDEKQRFDYSRYVRVLEVYLGINILLFRIERGVRVTLERPEYTGTYYRPWDSSKATVILTTENGESYEPLNHGTGFVFAPEYSTALADSFIYTVEETKLSYLNAVYPNHHVDIQGIVDLLTERDDVKVQGQHINDSGKCYAITTDRGRIDFPPSMPFLLPPAHQEEVKENTREVKWWDSFFQEISTEPIAMAEEEGNYRWFYIQLLRDPVSTDLRGGDSIAAHNMLKLRADSTTLEQILTWLARVLVAEGRGSVDTLTSAISLGSSEYDFTRVPKQLPEAGDVKEALSLIESWNTGLASGGVLLSFHPRFTPILRRLIDEKYRIARSRYAPDQEMPVIRTISAYTLTANPDSLVFAGENAYAQWLPWLNATYAGMESTITTINSIDEVKPWQLLPMYFWRYDVLLQQTTTRAKAMEISRQWSTEGRNPGYNPAVTVIADDPIEYEELVWSSERQEIIAFPERMNRSTGYYIILETGYCVAILPLMYEE